MLDVNKRQRCYTELEMAIIQRCERLGQAGANHAVHHLNAADSHIAELLTDSALAGRTAILRKHDRLQTSEEIQKQNDFKQGIGAVVLELINLCTSLDISMVECLSLAADSYGAEKT